MQKNQTSQLAFSRVRSTFFFTLIAAFTIAMAFLFRPFFFPLFWAAVIAVMFYPMYERLALHMHSRRAGSLFTVLAVLLIVVVPFLLIGLLLFQESVHLYNFIVDGGYLSQKTPGLISDFFQKLLGSFNVNWAGYLQEFSKWLSQSLFSTLSYLTQHTIQFVIMMFLMLYSLFFFFKDGMTILKQFIHFSPLEDEYDQQLFARVASTVRATLKGSLIVGLVQGMFGLVLFLSVGVKGALVWAVVMTACSLIPAFGPFLVWLPVGLVLLAMGDIWQGVVVLVVGATFLSTIDNFLRPMLIGKDTALHPVVILFSTLGGIVVFGLSGFIIGPVIAAIYFSLLSVYELYYKKELASKK